MQHVGAMFRTEPTGPLHNPDIKISDEFADPMQSHFDKVSMVRGSGQEVHVAILVQCGKDESDLKGE
jgi:hypothetical protein